MATPAAKEDAAPTKRPRKAISASARDAVTAATATPARAARRPKPTPAPATLIFFVRHGTTPTTGQVLPGRAPGLHLADSGKAEAEAVAERLAALTIPATPAIPADGKATDSKATDDTPANSEVANGKAAHGKEPAHATLSVAAVYASPLERARETAAPIGKRLGRKVAIEKGLIE
ncbi:MAG: hypothetical protein QOG97_271, partial [Acidimicrobiaceae bacterium]|nr:hypothetical protein [Acidimicrobiaceae bacterium]